MAKSGGKSGGMSMGKGGLKQGGGSGSIKSGTSGMTIPKGTPKNIPQPKKGVGT